MTPPSGADTGRTRIYFVLWTLEGMGGSERVVHEVARSLDRDRFDLGVIAFKGGPVHDTYRDMGLAVHVLERSRTLDLPFLRRFRTLINEERIDVLNPHHFSPFFHTFMASRGTRARVAYAEHSRWELECLNRPNRVALKLIGPRADAAVAVSRELERYFLEEVRVPRQRTHYITNGIDVPRFSEARPGLREELGLDADARLIGLVAHIRPEKNHKHLISAFGRVAERMPNVHLVLAGLDLMGGEVIAFGRQQESAGRIHFLGERSDVPSVLKSLDVFCLPSRHEGLPLSVLEAMAAGTPVVGADVLGINEVVDHERTGLLFTGGDVEALAAALERVLTEDGLAHRLADEAGRHVREVYDLRLMSKRYAELFERLAAEARS